MSASSSTERFNARIDIKAIAESAHDTHADESLEPQSWQDDTPVGYRVNAFLRCGPCC